MEKVENTYNQDKMCSSTDGYTFSWTQEKCMPALVYLKRCIWFAAPGGCLQYYTGTVGRMISLNYWENAPSNINNLNYGICVRREKGFCAIQVRKASIALLTLLENPLILSLIIKLFHPHSVVIL